MHIVDFGYANVEIKILNFYKNLLLQHIEIYTQMKSYSLTDFQ